MQQELRGASDYYLLKERCIFCDIVDQEGQDRRRVVFENDEFIAASPFAARFPFELWLIPKTHGSHFEHAATSYPGFASAIKASLRALKRSLDDPPFNYIIHSAPLREAQSKHYHWHMEIHARADQGRGLRGRHGLLYQSGAAGERRRGFARGARDDRRAARAAGRQGELSS